MKNIARIITFLFLSTYSFAQNKPIVLNSIKIKVKPIKPQSNLCIEKDNQETAIVMEYEVVEKLVCQLQLQTTQLANVDHTPNPTNSQFFVENTSP